MQKSIESIYSCWNNGDLEGVQSAFAELGPKGYSIEYVGNPPLDGPAAVQDMWDNYAGTCTTDIVQLIVNGDEAAALIHNNLKTADGITTLPSIETYRVENGALTVRYYHRTPESSDPTE